MKKPNKIHPMPKKLNPNDPIHARMMENYIVIKKSNIKRVTPRIERNIKINQVMEEPQEEVLELYE